MRCSAAPTPSRWGGMGAWRGCWARASAGHRRCCGRCCSITSAAAAQLHCTSCWHAPPPCCAMGKEGRGPGMPWLGSVQPATPCLPQAPPRHGLACWLCLVHATAMDLQRSSCHAPAMSRLAMSMPTHGTCRCAMAGTCHAVPRHATPCTAPAHHAMPLHPHRWLPCPPTLPPLPSLMQVYLAQVANAVRLARSVQVRPSGRTRRIHVTFGSPQRCCPHPTAAPCMRHLCVASCGAPRTPPLPPARCRMWETFLASPPASRARSPRVRRPAAAPVASSFQAAAWTMGSGFERCATRCSACQAPPRPAGGRPWHARSPPWRRAHGGRAHTLHHGAAGHQAGVLRGSRAAGMAGPAGRRPGCQPRAAPYHTLWATAAAPPPCAVHHADMRQQAQGGSSSGSGAGMPQIARWLLHKTNIHCARLSSKVG